MERAPVCYPLALAMVGMVALVACAGAEDRLISPSKLKMFVDNLPDMPRIQAYKIVNGIPVSKSLKIGMYHKKWKFHRDIPATPVFAYGESKHAATIPGPTIEALHGVPTNVTWRNHLPPRHILPWDPTIPTAAPASGQGVPTVVHLHGGIHEPQSDGHAQSWFTAGFKQVGPTWTKKKYHYNNFQHPGNLWYHDHAMGLTRVNLLAGLIGSYILRHPDVEAPLGLPYGEEFDRPLMVFDRSFRTNGSLYMNCTGNNPSIHPQWQPEYFGEAIIVNGKAWPRMIVRRRRYRFRIINASNARFFRFFFTNGLRFIHVASDSAYLGHPVVRDHILLAPSEIADVVVDFSESKSNTTILANDAPYPYPTGDPTNESNGKVMKFVIRRRSEVDTSRVPKRLIKYPMPNLSGASRTRYITMYEYTSDIDEPTHLYLNARSYEDPVTEMPKVGTSEVWNVINLTDDNHPLHIHLGLFAVLAQTKLVNVNKFHKCMTKMNDAIKCHVDKYARGKRVGVPAHEKGWKNVFKMRPGFVTKIYVRFANIHSNASYPFDATAEPGYVYHCHILDHEDNEMMRPMKLIR
ncbi:multicopper oxidase LPR2-like [Malania oleifera]|uniref:multicopper oxidase LPR2-like n=1 Tax=Malania oleifera TaxID=397392 RepID=UPI0025ADB64A|nr:multicopper oxidase LPR2-like [Malania oleifera]